MSAIAVKNNPGILVLIASGSSVSVFGKIAPSDNPRVTIHIVVEIKSIVEYKALPRGRLMTFVVIELMNIPRPTKKEE